MYEAGCSRVTHPFATKIFLSPFDLHVLGMPPAFVLSQDQTLEFNLDFINFLTDFLIRKRIVLLVL